MAEPVNQQIADALTAEHLRVARVETQLRREAWAVLALLEADLLAALTAADPTQFALLTRRRRAVAVLMRDELDPLIQSRYQQLAQVMDAAMMRLATHETTVVQAVVNTATGEATLEELPTERRLRTEVVFGLFPSPVTPTDLTTFGAEWWAWQGASVAQRLGGSLTMGVALEEPLPQLTTRIRGTSEAAFTDGLLGKARDDATRLVRTQVTHALGAAWVAVAARNATQVVLQHHARLEEKNVCVICFARHGKRYTADADHRPLGHSLPYLTGVPYHPLCRCAFVTVVTTGGAITDETLAGWLRRQGPAYQDAVLGPTRARMFRNGSLSPKNLLDSATGKPLTLEELGA